MNKHANINVGNYYLLLLKIKFSGASAKLTLGIGSNISVKNLPMNWTKGENM